MTIRLIVHALTYLESVEDIDLTSTFLDQKCYSIVFNLERK